MSASCEKLSIGLFKNQARGDLSIKIITETVQIHLLHPKTTLTAIPLNLLYIMKYFLVDYSIKILAGNVPVLFCSRKQPNFKCQYLQWSTVICIIIVEYSFVSPTSRLLIKKKLGWRNKTKAFAWF